jgi:hypothetical protein
MNELDGHSRHTPSRDRVPHDQHLNIFIAESLWTPTPYSLLREKTLEFRVFIQERAIIFVDVVGVGRERLDKLAPKELFDGPVFRFLPLAIHKLSRSCAGVA